MTIAQLAERRAESIAPADLLKAAQSFVPRIRERAPAMNAAGRLDDELIDDLDRAGLYSIFVPQRFGGSGGVPADANPIIELIGNADPSTAWVSSFFMLHNLVLCRFPMQAQEELYRDTASVRAAAVWGPPGKVERAPGGYRISGRWGYASGIYHASHALVPAMLEGVLYWFVAPKTAMTIVDDWDMTAMSATGSATIVIDDLFLPDHMGYPVADLLSADRHGGTGHPETAYSYPFAAFRLVTPSLTVGALDRAVELFREKLHSSKPQGIARLERGTARVRWVEAYETARVIRILRDVSQRELTDFYDRGEPQTLEAEANLGLHSLRIIQSAMQAVRTLVDGSGSSVYNRKEELRKIATDISMMATHALFSDYDLVIDRHARWVLGMGLSADDPQVRLS